MAAGTQRCLWSSPTRKQSPVWRLLCRLGRLGLALTQRRKKKSFLFAIGETWRKTFSAEDGAVAHGTAGGPRGSRAQSLAVPPSHAHGPGGSSGGGAGGELAGGSHPEQGSWCSCPPAGPWGPARWADVARSASWPAAFARIRAFAARAVPGRTRGTCPPFPELSRAAAAAAFWAEPARTGFSGVLAESCISPDSL